MLVEVFKFSSRFAAQVSREPLGGSMSTTRFTSLAIFALVFFLVSCEDLGTNPWEGWNTYLVFGTSISLPPGAVVPWVDPNPPASTRLWLVGDSIWVTMVYSPSRDTIYTKYRSDYTDATVTNIDVGGWPGELLIYTLTPLSSRDFSGGLIAFVPNVGNGANQLFLHVQYRGGRTVPDLIVRSLKINGGGIK